MNPLSLLSAAAVESELGRNMAGTPEACRAAERVVGAARKIYFAGRWTAGLPAPLEARMWEDLRDALGLEPGAATAAGVHDDRLPAHGCPVCDDALECACEPPLPMFGEPTDADRERADAMLKAALARPGVEL